MASPSTPSSDAPLGPSPFSFSYLPLELKSRICELAKAQDEAFFAMKTDKRLNTEWNRVEKVADRWMGKSLNALFLTSRAFHDAAVPFLFEVCLLAHTGNTVSSS